MPQIMKANLPNAGPPQRRVQAAREQRTTLHWLASH